MKRFMMILAASATMALGGGVVASAAQAHEMTCASHLPPFHARMVVAGFRCYHAPTWHNKIRYYKQFGLGFYIRDVWLIHHPCTFCTKQEGWKWTPIIFVKARR